jgi:hypothetical protein
MGIRNKKKSKKLDLLEMPSLERMQLMKEAAESFRLKVMEAKLWQSLSASDDLTINGDVICRAGQPLKGLKLEGTSRDYR